MYSVCLFVCVCVCDEGWFSHSHLSVIDCYGGNLVPSLLTDYCLQILLRMDSLPISAVERWNLTLKR